MILKLTLETERPDRILSFLKKYNYFRYCPTPFDKNDEKQAVQFIHNYRKFIEIIKLPDTALDENNEVITVYPTDEDKAWICTIVKNAFYEFTFDEYERNNFDIEVVDNCDGHWDNGKAFYVFPSSYTEKPVLNF